MRSASLATSPRLRRALDVLETARDWMSTRDLILEAHVCAVNSVISELRANGCTIAVRRDVDDAGVRRWLYRLEAAPAGWRDA